MAQAENVQVSRDAFEAWNKHDPERYAKLLDEQHVIESDTIPAPVKGRAASRDFMMMYVNAFPDLHFSIDQLLGSGTSS